MFREPLMQIYPLSEIGPEHMAVFIPILAVFAFIVTILTRHQQRMTEIIHGTASQRPNEEIAQLRHEVSELKQLVHQQMIALDSYNNATRRSDDVPLQKRLEQV